MAERRSLVEGVKPSTPPVDPKLETAFVYGDKVRGRGRAARAVGHHSRHRPVTAQHADSCRLFQGIEARFTRPPDQRCRAYTLCDILEQALEPWLKTNGYLS